MTAAEVIPVTEHASGSTAARTSPSAFTSPGRSGIGNRNLGLPVDVEDPSKSTVTARLFILRLVKRHSPSEALRQLFSAGSKPYLAQYLPFLAKGVRRNNKQALFFLETLDLLEL